jgi:transposase
MLPNDDHAKMVERQVNQLDRQALDDLYRGSGSMPFDPIPMLKMVLYQYCRRQLSPATWYQEAKLNDAMKWLGRGYQPSRRTWYDFRDRVGGAIEHLHKQMIDRAIQEGHADPTTVAQDGTFIAACASRHRMVNKETLAKRQSLLESVIEDTFDPAEILPCWMPPTESGRLELAGRMETAAKILTERIEKNTEKPSGKRKDPTKIVVSLSDPIAPLGRDKMKVYRPLYNIQYMIELTSNLILNYSCEAVVSDVGTLIPMIDKTQAIVGGRLQTVMADAAYCSILDLRDCGERNIELLAPVQANSHTDKKKQAQVDAQIPREEFLWNDAERTYQCPAGHPLNYQGRERRSRHGNRYLWQYRYQCSVEHCVNCPLAERCLRPGSRSRTIKRLEGQELLESQREKMAREEVKARYRLRSQTVERSFADGKANRGWHRFHGRGLQRTRTETGLMVLAQNVLILDRKEQETLNANDSRT